MNRYAARGIANDARDGRRVLVVTKDQREAHLAFDAITVATYDAKRISRVNGGQRIEHYGRGLVAFTTPRSSGARGLALDTIYLDTGVEATPEMLADLVPCLATSHNGELIRA